MSIRIPHPPIPGREPRPEGLRPAPVQDFTGGLTLAETSRLATDRKRALQRSLRAGPALERLGAHLVTTAHAAGAPDGVPGPRSAVGPVVGGPDRYAAGLAIPRVVSIGLLVVVGAVEFLFWWTLGRQSVRFGDHTSPAALQAVALAVLFPVVVTAGALLGAAVARLPLLPPGTRDGWYRARAALGVVVVVAMSVAMGLTAFTRFTAENGLVGAQPMPVLPLALAFTLLPLVALAVHAYAVHPDEEIRHRHDRAAGTAARSADRAVAAAAARHLAHHRAALALEARVHRLLAGYHRDVAASEARILGGRARGGYAGRFPQLRTEPVAELPALLSARPVTWLDVPVPPGLQPALEPSLRLLQQHVPGRALDGSS